MIDELLDSLVLNQQRPADELRAELAELCRGADDPDLILHSFQDKELLRIGVGDLLGKSDVRQTTAALSDLAETVLNRVADWQEGELRAKFGEPAPGAYVVLGLGKLGGRELSYHSDLDLLVVYAAEGATTGGAAGATTNHQFFTELAQRVIKTMSRMGPMGRLYAVDMRLRPTGKSGSLVLPLAEFVRYFDGGEAQLWERQSLTRARVVRGDGDFAAEVTAAVRAAALGCPPAPGLAVEVRGMRERLEANSARSLKRCPGGINDVEFAVQLLQLKYGCGHPDILAPNVWDALDRLEAAGLLPPAEAATLRDGYSFLRLVEARLRVVTDRPLNEVPAAADDRAKLARRLGFEGQDGAPAAERFVAELRRVTAQIRQVYTAVFRRERGPDSE